MERSKLKQYRKEAALWAGQGKKSMSVNPADLLDLLDVRQAVPPPSDLAVRLQRELAEARAQTRAETARVRTSYEQGYAAGVQESATEVTRLRSQLSAKRLARPRGP